MPRRARPKPGLHSERKNVKFRFAEPRKKPAQLMEMALNRNLFRAKPLLFPRELRLPLESVTHRFVSDWYSELEAGRFTKFPTFLYAKRIKKPRPVRSQEYERLIHKRYGQFMDRQIQKLNQEIDREEATLRRIDRKIPPRVGATLPRLRLLKLYHLSYLHNAKAIAISRLRNVRLITLKKFWEEFDDMKDRDYRLRMADVEKRIKENERVMAAAKLKQVRISRLIQFVTENAFSVHIANRALEEHKKLLKIFQDRLSTTVANEVDRKRGHGPPISEEERRDLERQTALAKLGYWENFYKMVLEARKYYMAYGVNPVDLPPSEFPASLREAYKTMNEAREELREIDNDHKK